MFEIVSRESAHYKRTEYGEEEREQEVDSRKQTAGKRIKMFKVESWTRASICRINRYINRKEQGDQNLQTLTEIKKFD